jgi:Icc protein|tara:strand:+ start:1033 stop:1821 length:789 start_codon:yes stop_codon:yes gene_type:complete
VLQISDLHLLYERGATLIGVDTEKSLRAVLGAALSRDFPDVLLVTGDIAHQPVKETYDKALSVLREYYDGPLLCVPGNHDVLAAMLEAGLTTDAVQVEGWSVCAFDTHEDDSLAALWTPEAEAALDTWLASASGNLLLATHHPLVEVGCPWLDPDRLDNAEALLDSFCAYNTDNAKHGVGGQIRAVVFGHAHQEVEATLDALQLYGAPSTCFQFRPEAQKFSIDSRSPGCRWLELNEDGTVDTHVQRVDFPLHIDLKDRENK